MFHLSLLMTLQHILRFTETPRPCRKLFYFCVEAGGGEGFEKIFSVRKTFYRLTV